METMAAREETCTILTSTSLPMMGLTLPKLTDTKNRYNMVLTSSHTLTVNCSIQQSYCKYTTGGIGAEITGSIQVASGSEEDLQSAVAYVGPIAVAVDASSSAFRVSHTQRKSFLASTVVAVFSTLYQCVTTGPIH